MIGLRSFFFPFHLRGWSVLLDHCFFFFLFPPWPDPGIIAGRSTFFFFRFFLDLRALGRTGRVPGKQRITGAVCRRDCQRKGKERDRDWQVDSLGLSDRK